MASLRNLAQKKPVTYLLSSVLRPRPRLNSIQAGKRGWFPHHETTERGSGACEPRSGDDPLPADNRWSI